MLCEVARAAARQMRGASPAVVRAAAAGARPAVHEFGRHSHCRGAPLLLPTHCRAPFHVRAEEHEPASRRATPARGGSAGGSPPLPVAAARAAAASGGSAGGSSRRPHRQGVGARPVGARRARPQTGTVRRIREATSGDGVVAAIARALEHAPSELDALALTAAFHRIAILHLEAHRLARAGAAAAGETGCAGFRCADGMELQLLHDTAVAKISSFEAQQCALTLWALAKLSKTADAYRPPAVLVAALMRRAHETAGAARPRHIANTFWACAALGVRPCPELLGALGRRVTGTVHEFGSQSIINILWALASLRQSPPHELAGALMQRATAVVPQSSAQGMSNMVWALGRLQLHPPPELAEALGRRTREIAQDLTPQGIATCLWGCASLRLLQEDAFDACVRACIGRRHASEMSAHELAITLWSVASLAKLAALSPDDKGAAWQRLYEGVGLLVQGLAHAASEAAHQLDPQAVSMVLWSVASLTRLPPPPSPPAAGPARAPHTAVAGGRQGRAAGQLLPPLSPTSSPRCVGLPSSIRERGASGRLVHRLLGRLHECSTRLSAQDVATCYSSLASLGVSPLLSLASPTSNSILHVAPSPTLSPTDPVPRGLLTLCPGAY